MNMEGEPSPGGQEPSPDALAEGDAPNEYGSKPRALTF